MGLMIGIALAAVMGAATPDGPLAPARAGRLQCYTPDTQRKTCAAIVSYAWAADGTITSTGEVLLSQNPTATMKATTPVVVRDGAVCGTNSVEALKAAEITFEGRPATPEMTEKVRAAMVAHFPEIGREVCTRYVAGAGGELTTSVSVDGASRPDLTTRAIWIGPDEGYQVRP